MALNNNISLNKNKQTQDNPFLSLSKRVKEGISSENIFGAQEAKASAAAQGTNIFGMQEAGATDNSQIGQQEEKSADEYFAEDENGEMAFDQNSFYDDAWGVSFGNSSATNPMKAGSGKTEQTSGTQQADTTELKENLTNLIKAGKTNSEINNAKEELKTAGVSDSEIEEIEEEAKKEQTGSNGSTGVTTTGTTSASNQGLGGQSSAEFNQTIKNAGIGQTVTIRDCRGSSSSTSSTSSTQSSMTFSDFVNGANNVASLGNNIAKLGEGVANAPETISKASSNLKSGFEKTTNFVTGNGWNTDDEVAENKEVEKAQQEYDVAVQEQETAQSEVNNLKKDDTSTNYADACAERDRIQAQIDQENQVQADATKEQETKTNTASQEEAFSKQYTNDANKIGAEITKLESELNNNETTKARKNVLPGLISQKRAEQAQKAQEALEHDKKATAAKQAAQTAGEKLANSKKLTDGTNGELDKQLQEQNKKINDNQPNNEVRKQIDEANKKLTEAKNKVLSKKTALEQAKTKAASKKK